MATVEDVNDLIEINYDTYNIKEHWLNDIAPKYLDIDNIDHLNVGLFGYTNEVMATGVRSSIAHRNFLYDEAFLNTASLTKSIYNKAKSYNYDIPMAEPASCSINFSITQESIEKLGEKQYDSLTGQFTGVYKLRLPQDNVFFLDKTQFIIEADILIQEKQIQTTNNVSSEYSYTAMYDYSNNNGRGIFSKSTNPYITTWVDRDPQLGDILTMIITIYQVSKSTTIFENFSSDLSDNLFFNIDYKNYLCEFVSRYTTSKVDVVMEKYFNDTFTPEDEYYHFYTYDNNKLTIFFSGLPDNFKPAISSRITVDTYTTLGTKGNFNYEGNPTYKANTVNFQSELRYFITLNNSPAGGKDAPNKYDIKQKLMYEFLTRDNLVTEFDLNQYFNLLIKENVVNASKITFLKKRDDIMKRCYAAFLLLRDKSGLIIPSNTINIEHVCDINTAFRIESGSEIVYDDNNYIRYDSNAELYIGSKTELTEFGIKFYQFYGDEYEYIIENDVIPYFETENEYYDIIGNLTLIGKGIYKLRDGDDYILAGSDNNDIDTSSDDDDDDDITDITRDYNLRYRLPFSLYYQIEPFPRLVVVKNLINDTIPVEFTFANSNINSEFIINSFTIQRCPISFDRILHESTESKFDSEMNMNITHYQVTTTNGIETITRDIYYDEYENEIPNMSETTTEELEDIYDIKKYNISFVMSTTLDNSIIESEEKLFICRALIKDENGTYQGYFDFVPSENNNNVVFNAFLETNDDIDEHNRICLVNSVYGLAEDENLGELIEYFYIDEFADIEICVLLADDETVYDSYLPEPLSIIPDLEENTYTLATTFVNIKRHFTLFRTLNDIVQPQLDFRSSSFAEQGIIIKSIPVLGSHYLDNFEVFKSFYETFSIYYEVLEENFNKLENNTSVDIKFYNTFGFSQYFSCYSTNIKLGLVVHLAGSYTNDLDVKIKNYIVEYVEKVNETTSKKLALSNLMRGMESNFEDIDYVEFEHLDNTNHQVITCNTPITTNLTRQQLINYIPEFINVHIGSEAYIYGADDFVTGINITYK